MRHHDLARLLLATAEGEGSGGSGAGSGNGTTDAQGTASGSGGQGDGDTGNGHTGGRSGTGGGAGPASTGSSSGSTSSGKPRRKLEDQSHEELVSLVRGYRDEAAEHRTKRNSVEAQITDLQAKVAEALGVDTGDKPDPERLASELAEAQRRERMRSIELAVWRSADERGADPAGLLDSRAFLDSVSELDPGADDFGTRLGDKIAAAAQNNPRVAKAEPAGHAGGRPGGGIGQGGRGQQSGPIGVAAGRALHRERKGAHGAAVSTS